MIRNEGDFKGQQKTEFRKNHSFHHHSVIPISLKNPLDVDDDDEMTKEWGLNEKTAAVSSEETAPVYFIYISLSSLLNHSVIQKPFKKQSFV